MSFEIPQQVKLNSRVRHRRVESDGVVVCMHTGNVLVVNEVGAHIVEQLNKQTETELIVESICDEFDVSTDVATSDLSRYLQQLIEQDVIAVVTDGSKQDHVQY